jgi:hypothetical protein
MSRGMGRVERDVLMLLCQLRNTELGIDYLAEQTVHHPESVRRAMKSLARKGRVQLGVYRRPTARLQAQELSAEEYSTLTPGELFAALSGGAA